jgi:hypothetical protein
MDFSASERSPAIASSTRSDCFRNLKDIVSDIHQTLSIAEDNYSRERYMTLTRYFNI